MVAGDVCSVITLFLAMYMVLPDLQRYVWCRAVMATYVCVHAAVEIALAIHKHRQTIKRFLHLNCMLAQIASYVSLYSVSCSR